MTVPEHITDERLAELLLWPFGVDELRSALTELQHSREASHFGLPDAIRAYLAARRSSSDEAEAVAKPEAWALEVDINGPCLVLPVFLSKRDVERFKAVKGNREAVFRPLYTRPVNTEPMFDCLEALGRLFPDLRGYYARATGGADWAGIAAKLAASPSATGVSRDAVIEECAKAAEAHNEEHGDPADTLHHGRSIIDTIRALAGQP